MLEFNNCEISLSTGPLTFYSITSILQICYCHFCSWTNSQSAIQKFSYRFSRKGPALQHISSSFAKHKRGFLQYVLFTVLWTYNGDYVFKFGTIPDSSSCYSIFEWKSDYQNLHDIVCRFFSVFNDDVGRGWQKLR